MAEVTVSQFAEVLKVPVDRLLVQLVRSSAEGGWHHKARRQRSHLDGRSLTRQDEGTPGHLADLGHVRALSRSERTAEAAAIDAVDGVGDEGGTVGRQERDDAGDFLRPADTA